jgi:hypothetical protein
LHQCTRAPRAVGHPGSSGSFSNSGAEREYNLNDRLDGKRSFSKLKGVFVLKGKKKWKGMQWIAKHLAQD